MSLASTVATWHDYEATYAEQAAKGGMDLRYADEARSDLFHDIADAAIDLVDVFPIGELVDNMTDGARYFTCDEIEILITLFKALGDAKSAKAALDAHIAHDDPAENDQHCPGQPLHRSEP